MGVQAGWTVVDVGGWYTEVLSAAVGPQGKVYMQVGPRARPGVDALPKRRPNVEMVSVNLDEMQPAIADAAVTALNIHHTPYSEGSDTAGRDYVRSVYNILKPGGVAASIDHVGLPNIDNSGLHHCYLLM